MKRIVLLLSIIVFTLGSQLFFSFTAENKKTFPAETIKLNYIDKLNLFINSCKALDSVAQNNLEIEVIQQQLVSTRNSYKSIEFLFEYLDPEGAKNNINGAPLPKLEPKADDNIVVLQPKGLQVLDELIFSEDTPENREEIKRLTTRLVIDITRLKPHHYHYKVYDRIVIEATRAELIRILSLELTGFDTPLSGNSMAEAQIAFQSLSDAWENYYSYIAKKDPELEKHLQKLFKNGNKALQKGDFDNFNRIDFGREIISPLYKSVLDAQLALEVETYYETERPQVKEINFLSPQIFSDDFLNPYSFTRIKANENSEALTQLGKTLFYDPILSGNNKRACSSCHNPTKGFVDGVAKSIAMDLNGTVDRNAPTLLNAVYADRFFHDMRASTLDHQTEHVFYSEKEFNTDYETMLSKLNSSNEYKTLFAEAYHVNNGDSTITKHQLNYAFSSFILSLRSYNSPVDRYVRGEDVQLDKSVKNGFNLFMGKAVCGTCHFAPTFSGLVPPSFEENESEVLGIALNPYDTPAVVDPDGGRAMAGILKEESTIFLKSFKTPTIRNIALTAPYMHNGAYNTLKDVVDFYNLGGGKNIGIELENQTLPFDSLNLTDAEVQDIIVFMEALTDTTGLTSMPQTLPKFENNPEWNNRKIGGEY